MPAKTRRKYEGNAVATTITSNLGNAVGDTSISVQAATGWPSSGPFYVVIDPGTASEEKMLVGAISGTALSSITRGVDGTSRVSHSSGASIYPVFTAVDADEANELTSKYATRGDMVYQGASTFETLAKGTQHHVLKQGANDPAWGFVTNDNVDSSAAIALSKLGTGALPTAITVASANIVNDTIVDADINSAAAIALSKLATGALPTGITVASANLVDGTIVDADVNASAAISLSKLATGALPTAITVASANIVDGTIVNADIDASAAIALTKLESPEWTTFTPTWTSGGTAPAIGNATVKARYQKIGRTVIARISIAFGSTSTFGTGGWRFALPLTASSDIPIGSPIGFGRLVDVSAGQAYGSVNAILLTTTTVYLEYGVLAAEVNATVPFTWTNTDTVGLTLTYEAAS